MKVWFAASEAAPLVKTGGLADVIGALPKSLAKTGVEVTVVLPKYGDIPAEYMDGAVTLDTFRVSLGWRSQYCGLLETEIGGIRYLLIDNEYYFKRGGLYGYGDDAERFVFYALAFMEALRRTDEVPDLVHAHDWQAGLIPFLLRTRYSYLPKLREVRTVYTIHNLMYQGVFSRELLQDLLAVGDEMFTADGLEFYGAGNCMKAGLRYADKLTTVSPAYAEEIQSEPFGEKLDGLLRQRADDLSGIVNGIDTDSYDPMTDPHLKAPFRSSLAKKRLNKTALQQELGLAVDGAIPLIGIVSRLVRQKGFDLLAEALPQLMEEGVQLAVLGSGDPDIEALLREAEERYPGRVATWFGFNEGLARRIYAGADMFLMPSRFEPCGLSQLISLRYRTVPVVRETGGLRDTVTPYNEHTGDGDGFTFGPAAAHDLLYTVRRAIGFYGDRETWQRIVANGAKKDYGWDASSKLYRDLYRSLAAKAEAAVDAEADLKADTEADSKAETAVETETETEVDTKVAHMPM
ncbi:glycogen synthase GlgA [Paenibacillus ginsengarvi]|uniref:Glycogen synthase n=2 Tax=Paenibacillus ginsengarvi TaxID=400777 RepID=A0A3B0C0T7_9BACL|nr:glycogen synthase GlgA [Paenibacillus ginsengarvi]RKN79042.1 glycogen synthase GlgA [Paenibacillus ginsengarvi]